MMPDPAFYVLCLKNSFDALKAASVELEDTA
jgi:hypothetical protein